MSNSRPFRIWNCSRQIKKSLVASSLTELQNKSKQKLGLDVSAEVSVVLEHDGTVVDDDEYFSCLDNDSTLIILKEDEKWKPRHGEDKDEPDSIYRAAGVRKGNNNLEELANKLKQDLSKIVLFSRDQLQLLVDSDESELSQLLGNSLEDTKSIQSACQRYLDEKQQVNDAVQLINILKNQTVDHVDGKSPNKKQRTQ